MKAASYSCISNSWPLEASHPILGMPKTFGRIPDILYLKFCFWPKTFDELVESTTYYLVGLMWRYMVDLD